MAKGITLHKVAAPHHVEARKHKLSPLEWGPDEKKHPVESLFDEEADPQGKDDQEGKPDELVDEWAWLQATRLEAFSKVRLTAFEAETHIEQIKGLALIEVRNDKPDTKQA